MIPLESGSIIQIPIIFGYVTGPDWFEIFRTRKRLEVPENPKLLNTQKNTQKHKQIPEKKI